MTTSVTTTCRDIDELTPVARKACILFFQECFKAGINIFVTETYRSQERQNYLYAQGRTRAGSIVTWTTSSRHKNRLAWDIGAATVNGVTNIYDTAIIKKAGAIAGKLGITWGGTWKNNLDYPHFEVSSNWTIPKGYAIEGTVSIPTKSSQVVKIVKSVSELPKVQTVIPDNKLEEVLSVTKNIPTIADCTTPTLKTHLINKIKEAKAKGVINSDQWLKAAEDGTLNIVDATLLISYIDREPTVADIESPSLKKSIIQTVEDAFNDKIITSKDWVDKAKAGTLTVDETLLLSNLINERRAGRQK